MWRRIRHRRMQALALVALSALLTTSLCLAPLYQRAIEQALTGSVLDDALPAKRGLTLTSRNVGPDQLTPALPKALARYVDTPVRSAVAGVSAPTVTDGQPVVTRLYAPYGGCEHVRTFAGRCPQAPDEVMVSHEDATENGWRLGTVIPAAETVDSTFRPNQHPHGDLRVVGVYEPRDDGWLGAPLTGRVGVVVSNPANPQASYVITDDWLTVPETLLADGTEWLRPTSSSIWPLDRGAVDVDSLLHLGPQVKAFKSRTELPDDPLYGMVVQSDLDLLAGRVAAERAQARTTVTVLVAQLVVLVAIVLWMVLVSATDNRRSEVALARLRGRGRRGATSYLLAELLPLGLLGVVLGVLAAPLVMGLVARAVFPLHVPMELRRPLGVAAVGGAAVVGLVMWAAVRRAAGEPVDSLLRRIPRPRPPGAGEAVVIVFSLATVVLLVTVDLVGPLATLAPTLLAVATGLLLARALRRSVVARVGGWMLGRGWSASAAGVLSSIRRPAARRVLVMVLVASALAVFCGVALVTGERNRANAADQAAGAPYVLAVRPLDLGVLVETLDRVDPSGTHLTPVVRVSPNSEDIKGLTLAVRPRAWARVAAFPLADRSSVPWQSILAPRVEPIEVAGDRLRGTVEFSGLAVEGNPALRDVLEVVAMVRDPEGTSRVIHIADVPAHDGRVRVDADLHGHPGYLLTGLGVTSANTVTVSATLTFSDLSLDGRPLDLTGPDSWRRVAYGGGSVAPASDASGDLAMKVTGVSGATQPMLHEWVPDPVPALVSSPEPDDFLAPGLSGEIRMHAAAMVPRVAGAPPGARVVDLEGLLRRPDAYPLDNTSTTVWGDDRQLMDRAADALRDAGIPVDVLTTRAEVRQRLDDTPAAWALGLSVLVGSAAVLIAGLVLLVVTATTWRSRAADLAALRMTGVRPRRLRRLELLATLPMILLGCLGGSVCGVVAAHFALPDVRQFTDPPAVPTTDFSVPWSVVGLAALGVTLVLVTIAFGTSAWTTRRSRLAQLRQTA